MDKYESLRAEYNRLWSNQIARSCHEANRAFCEYNGDFSQVSWEDAPEWQRESAIMGVMFHLENPDADASASHDAWLAKKAADGWKYGPAKDETLKEHPCIVPFAELPAHQQFKDILFRTLVHAGKTEKVVG